MIKADRNKTLHCYKKFSIANPPYGILFFSFSSSFLAGINPAVCNIHLHIYEILFNINTFLKKKFSENSYKRTYNIDKFSSKYLNISPHTFFFNEHKRYDSGIYFSELCHFILRYRTSCPLRAVQFAFAKSKSLTCRYV